MGTKIAVTCARDAEGATGGSGAKRSGAPKRSGACSSPTLPVTKWNIIPRHFRGTPFEGGLKGRGAPKK
jgi:hypothetical protein